MTDTSGRSLIARLRAEAITLAPELADIDRPTVACRLLNEAAAALTVREREFFTSLVDIEDRRAMVELWMTSTAIVPYHD